MDVATSGDSGERMCVACGRRYPSTTRFCPEDGQALKEGSGSDDHLVGELVAGRYYVERRLGIGGMGVVYLATHVLMSRSCALKVLRSEYLNNPEAIGRFTRGAQNAAKIAHPNVATVFDFGEVGGETMYLAMEYIDGPALSDVITLEGPLDLPHILVIVVQTAEALDAAHDLGIVHRDLKPENIMLARSGVGDVVKVVDFGISRAIVADSQRVTDSNSTVGTPAYMSPEQIRGTHVDERSDLYSLALVTYELLTGRLPLSIEFTDIALRFLEPVRSLQELKPDVTWPRELQDVLSRALSANADERQRDMPQFVRELLDACRLWRPADVASALSTLAELGMGLSIAFPVDSIARIATPPPQPALDPEPKKLPVSRRATIGVGALAALSLAIIVMQLTGTNAESSVPPAIVRTSESGQPRADSTPRVVLESTSAPTPGAAPETPPAKQQERPEPRRQTAVNRVADPTANASGVDLQQDGSRIDSASKTSDTTVVAPPPEPAAAPVPAPGFIRIGSPRGAMLYLGEAAPTFLRTVSTFTVPSGESIRIRLRLDSCGDWDSTVTVRAGQTLQLGLRNPLCPP